MFDIYDKSNYKECRYKRYKAYMCILPEGTLVRPINNTISLIFHDKLDSLYADKLEVIKKEIQMRVTRVITKDAPFLVVEPAGKFLILNFNQVVQNYKLDINNSYREITREILEPRIVNNYMDWVGVVPSFKSTNKMVACFVRKSEKFSIPGVGDVNTSGRGKGDFLICNQLPNNNIDFSSMRIVSNNYFSATFDNRGYETYLDTYNYNLVMADLPRLPIPVKENNNNNTTKKDELDELYSLILSKSKYYNKDLAQLVTIRHENKALIIKSPTDRDTVVVYNYKMYIFTGTVNSTFSKIEDALDCIIAITNVIPKGISSKFYSPVMSKDDLSTIQFYTGMGYNKINSELRSNDLDIDTYLSYCNLYNLLGKCRIRSEIPLYRGMSIKENSSEIDFNNFMSTSLVLDVASKFGNTVYKITNAKDLQALYVNPLSNFRDLEYEVLVNVGYQMKVGKPLYKYKKFNGQDITVYEAKLVPNKNFKDFQKLDFSMKDIYIKDIYHDLISKSEVQSKSIVTVAYDILTIGFESYRGKTDFTINISFKANKFSIYEENTDEGTRQLVGHYPYKEESKKELYKYLKVVYEKADGASKNNNLLLYTQMARKFTDEGFIVKLENIKSVGFHLILTGDDDDHIALHFDTYMKDNKYGICVKAKSNNIKINKSREFESIDMVVNSIYSLVVKTFKLNSANRADKVISLIAMYRGTTYKKQMIEPTLIMYTVDGVDVHARLSGTDIEYTIASQSLITSHFDNITKVSSSVYSLGKTLGEFK